MRPGEVVELRGGSREEDAEERARSQAHDPAKQSERVRLIRCRSENAPERLDEWEQGW